MGEAESRPFEIVLDGNVGEERAIPRNVVIDIEILRILRAVEEEHLESRERAVRENGVHDVGRDLR